MENKENNSTKTETKSFFEDWSTWRIVRIILIAFTFLIFYIYNSLHTAKSVKTKKTLHKELKELHSERISLESEITRASKQTKIAEKLKESGLKESTTPPIKIIRESK